MSINMRKVGRLDPGIAKHSVYDHSPKIEIRCHVQAKKKAFFAGASDGSIYCWNQKNEFNTLVQVQVLKEHKGPVGCLLVLEDLGRYGLLASGSSDRRIKIWSPWNEEFESSLETLKEHQGTVLSLAKEKNLMFSSSTDNTVIIYDALEVDRNSKFNFKVLQRVSLPVRSWIYDIAVGRVDGPKASLCDNNGIVHFFNNELEKERKWSSGITSERDEFCPYQSVGKKRMHARAITHAHIAENENYLWTLSHDGTFQGYDLRSNCIILSRKNPNKCRYTGLAWASTKREIVLADEKGYLQMWKFLEDSPLVNGRVSKTGITSLTFSSETDTAWISERESAVMTGYRFERANREKEYIGHRGPVIGLTCVGDDDLKDEKDDMKASKGKRPRDNEKSSSKSSLARFKLFSISMDGTLRCWDPYDVRCIQTMREKRSEISAVLHVSQKGRPIFATGHNDGTLRIWNFLSGNCLSTRRHRNTISGLCFVKPGIGVSNKNYRPLLASCSFDKTVNFWDMSQSCKDQAFQPILDASVKMSQEELFSVVHNSVSNTIVTGGNSAQLYVWNVGTKTIKGILKGHTEAISALEVDMNIIISGSDDFTVRVWDSMSLTCISVLEHHHNPITCLKMLCPLGFLASCGSDGELLLWNYPKRIVVHTYNLPSAVRSIVYSSYKHQVLVGIDDGDIFTYQPPNGIPSKEVGELLSVTQMLKQAEIIAEIVKSKSDKTQDQLVFPEKAAADFWQKWGDVIMHEQMDNQRAHVQWNDSRLLEAAGLTHMDFAPKTSMTKNSNANSTKRQLLVVDEKLDSN